MEIIKHLTFCDNRGSYTPLSTDILGIDWTQCCISCNDKKFTFRGMHYQTNPPQEKYIKVIQGSIIDFIIDLKTNELDSVTLNKDSAVFIPDNKAHGFLTLEPNTIVAYLVKGVWDHESEHSLVWHEHLELNKIVTSIVEDNDLIISDKDRLGK